MSEDRWVVPFTDFDRQFAEMADEIMGAIRDVLESGDLILRAPVRTFEERLAAFLKSRHVVGVSSGTDALRLALLVSGIGPGDEVITVAHTFVATVSAIVSVGASPVLVDVGDDHNMDLGCVKDALTPRTKAIIPAHLNGRMVDMATLQEMAGEHGAVVIEDAAQAMGSMLDGKGAGTWGRLGCLSFFPGKVLGGLGDAGAIVTDDDALVERLRLLRDHGRISRTELGCWGLNCRIDSLHAAALSVKLPRVPQWIERRRVIAYRYDEGMRDIPDLVLPPRPDSGRFFDVFQSYVVEADDRDELAGHLASRGIEALAYWPVPLHKHEALGLSRVSLPRTEAISRRVLSLPMLATLTDDAVDCVVQGVREHYGIR